MPICRIGHIRCDAPLRNEESPREALAAKTVDAILTVGLDTPYRVRRDVLDAYGYRLPWSLPDEREIADGKRLCTHELHDATWPSYMLDYGQRIWDWNRYMPRVLGLPPGHPSMARFTGLTLLDLAFNPAVGTNRLIANPDVFFPLMTSMFKIQTQAHTHEAWFGELIARASAWPEFLTHWSQTADNPDHFLATQPVFPIEIAVPNIAPPLRFRVSLIYLSLDPRFQVVHFLPFGAATLRQCAVWAEEESEH